ncbi:SGNH/GDSL hydrolase family protein, partial [Dietzia sp. DQ12-76]|nr:SGNH/GDSL hydrolase family protein [Dietzia sp. DQ12-76]
LEAAESAADDAETAAASDALDPDHTQRESVVARLTKRLTDFVRTHEDADDADENTYLHNEDVDGDPESTGDAREAADTLRRRSRILRLARPSRDQSDPGHPTDHT